MTSMIIGKLTIRHLSNKGPAYNTVINVPVPQLLNATTAQKAFENIKSHATRRGGASMEHVRWATCTVGMEAAGMQTKTAWIKEVKVVFRDRTSGRRITIFARDKDTVHIDIPGLGVVPFDTPYKMSLIRLQLQLVPDWLITMGMHPYVAARGKLWGAYGAATEADMRCIVPMRWRGGPRGTLVYKPAQVRCVLALQRACRKRRHERAARITRAFRRAAGKRARARMLALKQSPAVSGISTLQRVFRARRNRRAATITRFLRRRGREAWHVVE